MITKAQAKVGARVKWQSLDTDLAPTRGTITKIEAGRAFIVCDDPDPDTGEYESDTWLDSGASCWSLA